VSNSSLNIATGKINFLRTWDHGEMLELPIVYGAIQQNKMENKFKI
jgi:hypothetical protein